MDVGQEVISRRQAEYTMEKTLSRHRALYEGMRDGYFMVDMNGILLECNTSFSDMIGVSREQTCGESSRAIAGRRQPIS